MSILEADISGEMMHDLVNPSLRTDITTSKNLDYLEILIDGLSEKESCATLTLGQNEYYLRLAEQRMINLVLDNEGYRT